MTKTSYDYFSVNLEIKDKSSDLYSVLDSGILYGYGVFETILIQEGKPVLMTYHYDRMMYGASLLEIHMTYTQEEIEKNVQDLIEKNGVKDGVINFYMSIERGPNITFRMDYGEPLLLMVVRPKPDYDLSKRYKLTVREESFQRVRLDQIKTMSYLKNLMEKRLAHQFDEVLLFDQEGYVHETTTANIFFVHNGKVITPESNVILPGTTRRFIIENQEDLGISVEERPVLLSEVADFDEVFMTSALRGVALIDSMDMYLHLGSGEVSQKVQDRYQELIKASVLV